MAKNKRPRNKRNPGQKRALGAQMRRRVSRKKIMVSRVLSPRHKAHLIRPKQPFVQPHTEGYESDCFVWTEYDPKTMSMKAQFWWNKKKGIKGGIYIFWEISPDEWLKFLRSSSKGRYFYYRWRIPTGKYPKPYTPIKRGRA